jgi:hypothetical protein
VAGIYLVETNAQFAKRSFHAQGYFFGRVCDATNAQPNLLSLQRTTASPV